MCLLQRESWTQRTTSKEFAQKPSAKNLARPCCHVPCVRGRPYCISLTSSRISTSIACWNVSCALMSPVISSSRVTEPDTKRNSSRLYFRTKNVTVYCRPTDANCFDEAHMKTICMEFWLLHWLLCRFWLTRAVTFFWGGGVGGNDTRAPSTLRR